MACHAILANPCTVRPSLPSAKHVGSHRGSFIHGFATVGKGKHSLVLPARKRAPLAVAARVPGVDPEPNEYRSFWDKLKAAFEIFFPPTVDDARNQGKKRLRMILIADRCTMSQESMTEMKKSIVNALSGYVEIDREDKVDLSVTMDPDLGTIYSVSVPVKRVKYGVLAEGVDSDGDYLVKTLTSSSKSEMMRNIRNLRVENDLETDSN